MSYARRPCHFSGKGWKEVPELNGVPRASITSHYAKQSPEEA
jgi:hypothetical protein